MSGRMSLWVEALIAMAEPVIWPPAYDTWMRAELGEDHDGTSTRDKHNLIEEDRSA